MPYRSSGRRSLRRALFALSFTLIGLSAAHAQPTAEPAARGLYGESRKAPGYHHVAAWKEDGTAVLVCTREDEHVHAEEELLAEYVNRHTHVRSRLGAGKAASEPTATIEVTYNGFSDEARAAFQYAVDIWSRLIVSDVPIRVEATWQPLGTNTLGSAGPREIFRDFPGAVPETWYVPALADAIAGEDVSPGSSDFVANFNSTFANWYYGLDGVTPPGQFDLVTVILHELGHGLGFIGSMIVDDGQGVGASVECTGTRNEGCFGFGTQYPLVYDRYAVDDAERSLTDPAFYPSPSPALGSVLRGGGVYFDGRFTRGVGGDEPARLYAPSTWNSGSSYSHFDDLTYPAGHPSSLMTPFLGMAEAIHDPGPLTCALFEDLGWGVTADCGTGFVPFPPSPPRLDYPANGAVGELQTLLLRWEPGGGADTYDLQLAPDESFAEPVLQPTGLTSTSYPASGLEAGTKYFWRVRGVNEHGVGAWSAPFSFTTRPDAPGEVKLLSPSDGAGGFVPGEVVLTWEAAERAETYMIQLTDQATFSLLSEQRTGLSTLSYTPQDLLPETVYYWRVRAANAGGTSLWSEPYRFTTARPVPSIPVLTSPAGGEVDLSPDVPLSWDPVEEADAYEVQVGTDETFAELVFERAGITGTRIVPEGLERGRVYAWRVRALNTSGPGSWSTPRMFTTIVAAPAAPALATPAPDAERQPLDVALGWAASPGAETYEAVVASDEAFAEVVWSRDDLAEVSARPSGLEYERTYHWRVRAANRGGAGPWSPVLRFTTIAAAPGMVTLGLPVDGAEGVPRSPSFSWEPVTAAALLPGKASGAGAVVYYRLQVSETEDFSTSVQSFAGLAETSRVVGPLAGGQTYFWRVQASTEGGEGPWSSVRRFATVPDAPSAARTLEPADGATGLGLDVLLRWEEAPRAALYRVQLFRADAPAVPLLDTTNLASAELIVEELEAETEYAWRVRAENAGGAGAWSTTARFSTRALAPSVVLLLAPADGEQGLSARVTFSWDQAEGATHYELQVDTSRSFAEPLFSVEATSTSREVFPVDYGTVHFWRVRGHGPGGAGPWSEPRTFTTGVGTSAAPDGELPARVALQGNYPNPFNPTTTIRFELPEAVRVRLSIVDALGRRVATLVDGMRPAGRHEARFEAAGLPSGVYLSVLEAGGETRTQRIVLLK